MVRLLALLLLVLPVALLVAQLAGCSHAEPMLPDLPSGWTQAGAAGFVILVVLLFLSYFSVRERRESQIRIAREKREGDMAALQEQRFDRLHTEYGQRIDVTARDLTEKFCKALDEQKEHCKAELSQAVEGFRGQVQILQQQNDVLMQKALACRGGQCDSCELLKKQQGA